MVNAGELREALGALPGSQVFRVGEMNDAGEVLHAIYLEIKAVAPQVSMGWGGGCARGGRDPLSCRAVLLQSAPRIDSIAALALGDRAHWCTPAVVV